MSGFFSRWAPLLLILGLGAIELAGCAVAPGGYYPGYADYYSPPLYGPGYVGLGWGPDYRVGPFHDNRRFFAHGGPDRGWHGPAGGRGIPSIPSRGGFRDGGDRGGGFHGGGFHGGNFHGGGHGRV